MESAVPTRPVPAAGPESPEPPGLDPRPAPAHLPRRQLRKTGEAGRSESENLQNFRSMLSLETRLRAAEIRRAGWIFHGMRSARSAPQTPEKVSAMLTEPQAREPALSSIERSISANKCMGNYLTPQLTSAGGQMVGPGLPVHGHPSWYVPSSLVCGHMLIRPPPPHPPLSGANRGLSFLREKLDGNS